MNAKFFYLLLVVLIIAAFATACAPAITGNVVPLDPAQPAENETVSQVPVTGKPAAEADRLEVEPRLWSGEIFQSDNNHPDAKLNIQSQTKPDLQNGCISEDSQPRLYSGCVE